MKFDEIKDFAGWLAWKKADRKSDLKILLGFGAVVVIFYAFFAGALSTTPSYTEAVSHQYVAACSAVGMTELNGYCIDSANNQHRVLIDADGHAFIDGIRKPVIR